MKISGSVSFAHTRTLELSRLLSVVQSFTVDIERRSAPTASCDQGIFTI